MDRVHRKNIRRAERAGLEVAPEPSPEALLVLRSMQELAAERSRQKGGGFRIRSREYFMKLHTHVFSPGIGELWTARKNGEIVAALAYLGAAGRAMTVRSGSSAVGYETRAMYLLQHAVIRRVRERGFTELNLGGVPEAAAGEDHPEHGLYDFKKGFGGESRLRTGLTVDL
jgi:lipid II:glycine glycyltransferase (peptidoglycan interpeptide bridge formation enzyme)